MTADVKELIPGKEENKKCNRPNNGKSMRIRRIWRNGSRWKKRNIWSLWPLYGETKPKNKEKQTKEGGGETIEKYRLSQGRMNNYKKQVKDTLTEKEDIDIMTINKIMKESAEKHLIKRLFLK